jgi:hypothetical protein
MNNNFKLNKSRKGQAFNVVHYYAVRIPIILILMVIFIYVSSTMESRALSSHDTRKEIVLNRIFYSPHSISYFDTDSQRVYPNIIDLQKFRDFTLDKAFDTRESRVITGKLELLEIGSDELYEAYINKENFDRWTHYTKFDQYENFIDKKYVLIKDDDELKKGVIKINFVIPND